MFKPRYLTFPALTAALFAASLGAFAQTAEPPAGPSGPGAGPAYGTPVTPGRPPGRRHHRRGPLARALKGLALSPEQRQRIRGFMQAYHASRKSAAPESRAQVVAQIKGVLTPGERSRFETRLQRVLQQRGARAPELAPSRPAP